jgi:outer membrane lipase/esterase
MAATNLIADSVAIMSHTLADGRSYPWQETSVRSIGAAGSGGWEDTSDGGMTAASQASALAAQGARQLAQGWTPPAGACGYAPSKLAVFGDLLADNGNTAAVEESLGQTPSYLTVPYSPTGDFSDGPKWTTDLAQSLGLTQPSQQENFAYEGATGGALGKSYSPVNPAGGLSPLDTFAGQIQQFEAQDGSFSPNDVVSVTFGGNDIFLASAEALAGTASSAQVITDSVNAIISGLGQLADVGAKHFLVSNSPDVTLAPIFSSAEFQASGATVAGIQALVNSFNAQLAAGLSAFQSQTGLDVKTLDLHALFGNIAADPSSYGFTNVTQPVLSSLPGIGSTPTYNPAINGRNPQVEQGSLFLDPLFDTTERGQMLIAKAALRTLAA